MDDLGGTQYHWYNGLFVFYPDRFAEHARKDYGAGKGTNYNSKNGPRMFLQPLWLG